MKILLVLRSFNKKGGISRYTAELAERFVKSNEVHLLTTNYDYEIPNLIVHKKPMIKKPFWFQILLNAYYNTKYSKNLKKKFDIDIIHSQGAESLNCDVLTAHSCHRASIKKHNEIFKRECSFPKYFFFKIARWLWPLNRIVLSIEKRVIEKGSKKIIAVSKEVKREILENYKVPPEKIVVIPNGVDLEKFKPNPSKRQEIRNKYNIKPNEKLLMFCGHNFRGKGLKFVIEALSNLSKEVKLLVVGGDNPAPYIKLASKLGVKNRIIFTGTVSKNIENYYQASDIFVFPTYYESFGLVVLEAMACGLPVLVSKVNGLEDIIKEGENGFFIKRDPEDIRQKVNVLIRNKDLKNQISKNARKTAEKYSWDEVAKKTLQVYRKVLESKKYE